MALTTDSKASPSFKLSQRRAHTDNNRAFYNESFESSYVVFADDIWASSVPANPSDAVSSGILAPVTLRLYNIQQSGGANINSYKAVFFWDDNLTNAATVAALTGKINPKTGLLFSDATYNPSLSTFGNGAEGTDINGGQRIGHIVPEILNNTDSDIVTPGSGGYRPILTNISTSTRIFPLDASDWFLDTFSGIVTQELDGSILNLNGVGQNANVGTHATLECFIYIGSFVSEVLGLCGGPSINQADLTDLGALLEAQIDSNTTLIKQLSGQHISDFDVITSNIADLSAAIGGVNFTTELNALSAAIDANTTLIGTEIDNLSGALDAKITANTIKIDDDLGVVSSDLVALSANVIPRVTANELAIIGLETNTTDISANFADLRTENIFAENNTFAQDVTIIGSLNIATSSINLVQANQVQTSGAFITLNEGEVGSGVTAGEAGIIVDRGPSTTDARIVWKEDVDLFKLGLSGSESVVATRDSDIVSQDELVLGGTNGNFTQSSNLTFNGSELSVTGDLTVSQGISATSISVGGDSVVAQAALDAEVATINSTIASTSGALDSKIDSEVSTISTSLADITGVNASQDIRMDNIETTIASVSASLDAKIDTKLNTATFAALSGQGGGGTGDVTFSQLQAVSADLHGQIEDINTSITQGASGVIGPAEDGSYLDGLFTDFVPTTPIGVAIDRFNEILLAVAPQPPATLVNISLDGISENNGRLSYGDDPGDEITGYRTTGVTKGELVTNIISNPGNITGTLNDGETATASVTAANAFGNALTGELQLVVDGITKATMDLALVGAGAQDDTTAGSATGFNVSAVSYALLNGSPLASDIFAYRTGTFTVLQTDLDDGNGDVYGHHTIQVIHTEAGSPSEDINVDNDATALAFAGQALVWASSGGTKDLSGVTYNTSGTVNFTGGTVENAYRNTFYTLTDGISWIGNGVASQTAPLPLIGASGEDKQLTGLELNKSGMTITSSRLLNQSVSVDLQIKRLLSRTDSAGVKTVTGILLDSVSANSTDLVENFNDENYRLLATADANYGGQNDWGTGGGGARHTGTAWLSDQDLATGSTGHTDGMLIANGRLSYPNHTTDMTSVTNGNFATALQPAGNPDYSSAPAMDRTFYRYFYFGDSGNVSEMAIKVEASTSLILVDSDATLTGSSEYKLEVLAPGATHSTILGTPQFYDASRISGDGIGIYNPATTEGPGGLPGAWRGLTFGTTGVKVVVVKITVPFNSQILFTRVSVGTASPRDLPN